MDWMTLSIEIIGFVILCIWIVVPIQEFRSIYLRMKAERSHVSGQSAETETEVARNVD
jgi:hypothetical protein